MPPYSFNVEKFGFTSKERQLFELIVVKDVLNNFTGTYVNTDVMNLARCVRPRSL